MSKPVTLSIAHQLGQREAEDRIRHGIDSFKNLSLPVRFDQEIWQDNVLHFRVTALGQAPYGTITVLEDTVDLEVTLPGILGFFANKYMSMIRRRGEVLLLPHNPT